MSSPNYISPSGLERIRRELEWLNKGERPRIVREVAYAASLGDRSENAEYIYGKKRLREIDARLHFLIHRLDNVQVIDPGTLKGDRVMFGAIVDLIDEDGTEQRWQILGEDEIDVEKGILSWKSPIATALLGRKVGDAVKFRTPGGVREIEITALRYEPVPMPPDDLFTQEGS